MVIVGVSDVAKQIFLLYNYIHCLVVVFSSPLTSFHLYSCSLHSYLWRDLQFGNVILVHQHFPYTLLSATYFCLGFFSPVPFIYPLPFPSSVVYIYFCYLPHFSSTPSLGYYTIYPLHSQFSIFPFICSFSGFGNEAPLQFSRCF